MANVTVDTTKLGQAIATAATDADAPESEQRSKEFPGVDKPGDGSDMAEVPLVRVKIQRDLEHIVTDVFQHEVDILRAVHGEDNVEVLEDVDPGYGELPDNAGAEYKRLQNKYDRRNFRVIQGLFPKGVSDVASASGLANKSAGRGESQAGIKIRQPAKKSSSKSVAKK